VKRDARPASGVVTQAAKLASHGGLLVHVEPAHIMSCKSESNRIISDYFGEAY
jgi:hypothetical protein